MSTDVLHRRLAQSVLFVVAIIWGCAFVTQRTAMQDLGPFAFNGTRFFLAALMLWAIVAYRGSLKLIDRSDWYFGVLLGGLLFAGASFQQVGVVTTSAGKAGFITGLYVVFIPLFLRICWRQLTSFGVWCGIFAALLGLFLLSISEQLTFQRGDLWVTLCAIAFAWHMILTGRWVEHKDPWLLAAIQFSVIAVVSLFTAAFQENITFEGLYSAGPEILYAGILSAGVGYTAQTVAQKYTSSVIVGIILSLESVFAALAGWLLLHELLTARQQLGCALMLAGTILAQLAQESPQKVADANRS
ncbi:MAG: DMT family transporter [Deltaproteobacteria bacterium]|nr:DMT family transporter [Deltaproteobacteria bacterium]